MGDFRARDADRDRFVELIEAAYVDGQLGDPDRELRVAQALNAASLDELQALTRDLQLPPGSAVSPAVVSTTPVRPTGRLRGSTAVATVHIYVSNTSNESGYLMTTMSGEVVRRFPYEP